jgi:chromosomal replication initiator protein
MMMHEPCPRRERQARVAVQPNWLETYKARTPGFSDIAEAVCAHFDLTLDMLFSRRRDRRVARPRQIAMYLCIELTKHSPTQVSRVFKRDHTTVLHGRRAIEDLLRYGDDDVRDAVRLIRKKVTR